MTPTIVLSANSQAGRRLQATIAVASAAAVGLVPLALGQPASAAVTPTATLVAVDGTVTSPLSLASVTSTTRVKLQTNGTGKTYFFIDGVSRKVDSEAPFELGTVGEYRLSAGAHTVRATLLTATGRVDTTANFTVAPASQNESTPPATSTTTAAPLPTPSPNTTTPAPAPSTTTSSPVGGTSAARTADGSSVPITWTKVVQVAGATSLATLPFNPLAYDWSGRVGRTSDAPLTTAAVTWRGVTDSADANRYLPNYAGTTGVAVRDGGFQQCKVENGLRSMTDTSRVFLKSCDLTVGVGAGAVALVGNEITSDADGVNPYNGTRGLPSLIEYNKIWRDGTRVGSYHHDGIQMWQGGNIVIRRNWISGWQVSAISVKSERQAFAGEGPMKNVLIEGNYLANPTGFYSLYVRDQGYGRPQYVTVRNNVFGKGSPITTGSTASAQAKFVRSEAVRDAAVVAGNAAAKGWIVWYGNISETTGKEITPPGGWIG